MSQYRIVSRLCDYFLWGGCFYSMGGVSDYSLICHAPLLYVAAWRQGGGRGSENGSTLGKNGVRIPRRESNYPLQAAEILTFGL